MQKVFQKEKILFMKIMKSLHDLGSDNSGNEDCANENSSRHNSQEFSLSMREPNGDDESAYTQQFDS
jgi:hypothetical protein